MTPTLRRCGLLLLAAAINARPLSEGDVCSYSPGCDSGLQCSQVPGSVVGVCTPCEAGSACFMNTFGGGMQCPEDTGRFGYVSVVCPTGTGTGWPSLNSGHLCPGGHECRNTSYATPCQAGFACPRGTNQSTPCYDDIHGGTAAERCPGPACVNGTCGKGTETEPIYAGSTIAAVEIVIAGLLILECIGVLYDRKRPPVVAQGKQGGSGEGGLGGEDLFPRSNDFIHLRLEHVSFHIRQDRVLNDLTMSLREGELCALMGESGSGKTTLLNVLGGRASYGNVSGTISLNGEAFEPGHVNVGFVPQQYLLFKELTVLENLQYSASLRLDRRIPPEQRVKIVDASVDLLGLTKCRDFVCDKNLTKARLSGGQLRRVGIGIELVTLPTILLLDEPTSALDAVNTRLVVQALNVLAKRGILIIASLHQPRFSVYQMIDTLMVLRQGEFILAGPREDSLPFMAANGYVPDDGENPADFFIEVAFGFIESTKKVKDSELPQKLRKHVKVADDSKKDKEKKVAPVTYDQFEEWFHVTYGEKLNLECIQSVWDRASALDAIGDAKHNLTDENGMMLSSKLHKLNQNVLEKRTTHTHIEVDPETGKPPKKGRFARAKLEAAQRVRWDHLRLVIDHWQLRPRTMPRTLTQFFMCGLRYALRQMRIRRMFATQCVLFLGLGTLCGGIMSPSPKVQVAPIFLILICAAFSCVVGTTTLTSLGEGALERDFFRHEAALGVFQAGEVLARMVLDLWVLLPLPLLFAAPLLGLTALHQTLMTMFLHLLCIAWAYTSIGYVVALIAPANAAVLYVAIAFILSTFFAGAFGITVKDVVKKPGLQPPYVPCQHEMICNGTTNVTEFGFPSDGYHDTQGYGLFTYLPGFWGLFGFQMLFATGLPFAEIRDNVVYEMKASFGYLPHHDRDFAVAYETGDVDWPTAMRWHLFGFGLALRVFAMLVFVARNYTLGEACNEVKILIRAPIQTLRTIRQVAAAAANISKNLGKMGELVAEQMGDVGTALNQGGRKTISVTANPLLNVLEKATGLDLDGDGDVGEEGGGIFQEPSEYKKKGKVVVAASDEPISAQKLWLKQAESGDENGHDQPTKGASMSSMSSKESAGLIGAEPPASAASIGAEPPASSTAPPTDEAEERMRALKAEMAAAVGKPTNLRQSPKIKRRQTPPEDEEGA